MGYSIYTQVQFCINLQASCNGKDNYFVADPYTSADQKALDRIDYTQVECQQVTLSMPKANGSVSEIQLLRPTAWLERNDIVAIGKSTYLKLPEMGLEGYATVTDLAHFRVTKSNTASEEDWAAGMVTGVFKHIANGVYHLRYDNDDTLGVTGTHPLYSLDRQQFIPSEDIKVGEHLLSKSGIITVVSKTYDPTPQAVYNLEVGQWHNFLVGVSGVVAHNSYYDDFVKFLDDYSDITSFQRTRIKDILQRSEYLTNEWNTIKNSGRIDDWVLRMKKLADGEWHTIFKETEKTMNQTLSELKALYPNAEFGYRGSITTGYKFKVKDASRPKDAFFKGNETFNPKSFDVDGFIVSDELYNKFAANGITKNFKDLRLLTSEVEGNKIADRIHNEFSYKFHGYKQDDIFTFRVWTKQQFIDEVLPAGYKMIK